MVKSELKKHAVGVVFRAFNARFSAKYRHSDVRDPNSPADESEQGINGDWPVSDALARSAKPPPLRLRTTSEGAFGARPIMNRPLISSPTETDAPVLPESSNSLLHATPESDKKAQRGRATKKMFQFLRHRSRPSNDSSISATSVSHIPDFPEALNN